MVNSLLLFGLFYFFIFFCVFIIFGLLHSNLKLNDDAICGYEQAIKDLEMDPPFSWSATTMHGLCLPLKCLLIRPISP